MADINILVAVDTRDIDQNNVDATITLLDDNQDTEMVPGISSSFATTVRAGGGGTIQWTPVAINGIDDVRISAILVDPKGSKGGDGFSMKPTLVAGGKAWLAKVADNDGDGEITIKYDIVVLVSNKTGQSFTLDPTIHVPPRDEAPAPEESDE
ncbi:MAG: hypothetical protein AAGA85_10670 [Bacteroidota bacterium]